jgi:DNA-binding response OmpR family regulator
MGEVRARRALVLDDDPEARAQAARSLEEAGFEVDAFASANDALAALGLQAPPTLIVSEVVMPGVGGLAFRRAYVERFPERDTPFLFMSRLADPDTVAAGLEAGADDFVRKPIVAATFRARVEAVLRRPRATESVVRGRLHEFPLVGLLAFCESGSLAGDVTLSAGDRSVRVGLRGQELDTTAADGDARGPRADQAVASTVRPPSPSPAATQARVDEGYERYLAKDFAGAIALWEEALAVDPSNKTLASNVAILKRRLVETP